MADDIPGLQDLVSGALKAAGNLDASMAQEASEIRKLALALQSGSISLVDFRDQLMVSMTALSLVAQTNQKAAVSMAKVVEVIGDADKTVRELGERRLKDLSKTVGTVTEVIEGMGSAARTFIGIAGSTTGEGLFKATASAAESTGSALSKLGVAAGAGAAAYGTVAALGLAIPGINVALVGLGAAAAVAGVVLSQTSKTAEAAVDASTRFAEVQRKVNTALVGSGAAVEGHTSELKAAGVALAVAGAEYGLSAQEAGNVAHSLAAMNIPLGQTADGLVTFSSVAETAKVDVDTAARASRGMGIDLTQATTTLGTFRVNLRLGAEEAKVAFGEVAAAQKETGQQAEVFAKRITEGSGLVGRFGGGLSGIVAAAALYKDALDRQIVSVNDLVAMNYAQAGGAKSAIEMTMQSIALIPETAEALGIAGKNYQEATGILMKAQADGNALAMDVRRQEIVAIAQRIRAGDSEAETITAMAQAAEHFGMKITDANQLLEWWNGGVGPGAKAVRDLAAQMEDQKAKAKENAEAMANAAKAIKTDVAPPLEQLNKAAITSAAALDILSRSAVNAVMRTTAAGAETIPTAPAAAATGASAAWRAVKATLGFSQTEEITAGIAGGRPATAGYQAGNLNVDVGGINIGGGTEGEVRGQLREELARVEDAIMRKIEDFWKSARHGD